MNKKLIAVAVAGVVAAPAANADEPTLEERVAALEAPPSISAYGRLNNAVAFTEDANGDNTQNLETYGSRFGFKGAGDIGNGMSAFARYEFSTTTDNASGDNNSGIGRRLAYVGLSGPFGSVSLGQQWSGYFKTIGTNASLNYWNGPGSIGTKREGNTIQYSNSLGPVSLVVDARIDDEGDGSGEGNGFAGGVTITPMDNVLLGAALDSDDKTNTDVAGFVGSTSFGGFNLTVAHEQKEVDMGPETSNTLLWLGTSVNNLSLLLGYGRQDTENADGSESDSSNLMIGGHYMIGGGLRAWGEFVKTETDGSDDPEIFTIGLRMDF